MAMAKSTLNGSLLVVVVFVATMVGAAPSDSTPDVTDVLRGINLDNIKFTDVFSLEGENANRDIDTVLALLSRILPNRLKVPDVGTDFNLHDCYVEGLASGIVRAGDVVLNVTDEEASFSFGLAVNDISVKCSWKRKVLVLTLVGTAKAETTKVGVSAAINVKLQSGASPVLKEFRVLHLADIKTSFTGLGFLNKLAGALGNVLVSTSRDRIVSELEGNVARQLQSRLDRLKVPKLQ